MSEVVSIVSVVISVAALVVAIYVHRRQHSLQERTLSLEEAREKDRLMAKGKALLTAQLIADPVMYRRLGRRVDEHFLRMENKGAAEAREIELRLDGKPVYLRDIRDSC